MIVCGCNLFEWGTFLRRIDNFLMDLVAEPESVERLLDALMEVHLTTLEKVGRSVCDVVDIIRFGDDLGMDTGPFMSGDVYRKLFKRHHARLYDYVHRHSSMHTFLHSCGSIHEYLPDLIDAGLEIINPVQTTCYPMEPDALKREFGRHITFWGGGCDTRPVLNRSTPQPVRDGLDRFQVDPYISKTDTAVPRVTVGKEVVQEKLFMTYSSNVGATYPEQVFRIEYILNRNVSLVGDRNEIGNLGADVKFRFEFRYESGHTCGRTFFNRLL